jgi:hypothetical protein
MKKERPMRTIPVFFWGIAFVFASCNYGSVETHDGPTGDLMVKFGVKNPGLSTVNAAHVTETFNKLHEYLQSIAADPGALNREDSPVQLGDYIDLPFLFVEGYPLNEGASWSGEGKLDIPRNYFVYDSNDNFYAGSILRLIVVGRNSFNTNYSSNTGYAVTANNNGGPHLVFQFQHTPVQRRMNADNTNNGGYRESEMRKYLVPVAGDDVSGKFLAGLTAAGAPEDILWAPARYLVNDGVSPSGVDEIRDKIWLPSFWEILGFMDVLTVYETAQNQTRLEYYHEPGNRRKWFAKVEDYVSGFDSSQYWSWWLATPTNYQGRFFAIYEYADGRPYSPEFARGSQGIAPAFCIH